MKTVTKYFFNQDQSKLISILVVPKEVEVHTSHSFYLSVLALANQNDARRYQDFGIKYVPGDDWSGYCMDSSGFNSIEEAIEYRSQDYHKAKSDLQEKMNNLDREFASKPLEIIK